MWSVSYGWEAFDAMCLVVLVFLYGGIRFWVCSSCGRWVSRDRRKGLQVVLGAQTVSTVTRA